MAVTPLTSCEHYNGDTWSSGGNLNTARHTSRSNGIQTAALVAGGSRNGAGVLSSSESYNGTAWSAEASLATAGYGHGGGGSGTSVFITGGYTGSASTNRTEEYSKTLTARTVTDSQEKKL